MHEMSPIWQGPWYHPAEFAAIFPTVSSNQYSWLNEQGSLTARLKATGQPFDLQLVLEQTITFPQQVQPLVATATGMVREVVLCLSKQPVVFAQSFLPQSLLEQFAPLAALGQQPLGEFIFQQPSLQRKSQRFTQLPAMAFALDAPFAGPVLGRQLQYQLADWPFIVQEFFLQELP